MLETLRKPSALYGTYCWSRIYTLMATHRENQSNRITYFFPVNRYNIRIIWWVVITAILNMKQTSETRIQFHQMQQGFLNNLVTCSGYWRCRSDCYFVLITTSLVVTTITFRVWRELGWVRLHFRVDSWSFVADLTPRFWSACLVPLIWRFVSDRLWFLWSAVASLIGSSGLPCFSLFCSVCYMLRRHLPQGFRFTCFMHR
jgi:hypothetical protein